MKSALIKTLIIPAAGSGTRLLPITKVIPKEMLRLVDKPVIHYIIDEAYQSGIRHVVLIINPWKQFIREYFVDKRGRTIMKEFPKLKFSFIETSNLFGDGYAIFLARKLVKSEPFFAISMGDLLSPPNQPFLKQLIDLYVHSREAIISVEAVEKSNVNKYGIIAPRSKYKSVYEIADIIEKPSPEQAPSNLAMTGKFILSNDIFSYLETLLRQRRDQSEVKLSDALKKYVKEHKILALECQGKHFDVGNKTGFLKTEFLFAHNHNQLGKTFRKFLKTVKIRRRFNL